MKADNSPAASRLAGLGSMKRAQARGFGESCGEGDGTTFSLITYAPIEQAVAEVHEKIQRQEQNGVEQPQSHDHERIPGDRWANALRGSSFFFVPSREVTPLWSNKVPTYEEEGQDLAAYLNYKLGDHLFIELAADVNEGNKIGNTAVRRGWMDLYLDINRVLPNGAANPNSLHPYTEFMEYRNVRNDRQENLRAQVVYSRDFRYGKMSFSAMAGSNKEKGEARARTLLLPLTSARLGAGTAAVNYTGLDARAWVDNEEYSEFGV